jgi:hypothetical protein
MTSKWFTKLLCGVALAGMSLSSTLPAAAEQAPDKNGPGVTRVSVVQGTVVVQRGDSNKQVTARVNAPLLPGDYVSTGASSRGELQFDGSTAVRMGGNVQARITNDDPNNRQLQLADGTIVVGLVRNDGEVQVDTPSVTVRSNQAGDYRVSIGKDGSSWVTTRRGQAEVVTPQRTYTLESGRTLVARGSASAPEITFASEIAYDSFDDFNAKRDQTMVAALNASPNLNPDIAGYDNLGAYGQWQDVAGYGQVWVPDQTSGWSPYSDGSWVWEGGYGWTWVGNEPWGWAPYHYGNWFYANGYGWAWYPPAYNTYPAWSPALVGFFGFGVGVGGPGWGVSVGFGYPNIGWYPLWPYAPYYPWGPGWAWSGLGWGGGGWGWGGWGCCGYGYGGNVVNITHITNITNIYRHFPHGGIHGTTVGNFQHGAVSGHTFSVDPHTIGSHVGMIHGAVPVTPTRDSLGFGGHSVSVPVTLSKAFDSPRFASADRALAGRTSFDDQAKSVSRAIDANGSHANAPVSHENAATSRENEAASHETTTGSHSTSDSWQRFDQARGTQNRANAESYSTGRTESGAGTRDSFANQGSHEDRAPSDSWSRFSHERGNVSASESGRDSYAHSDAYGRDSYGRDSYGSSYGRDSNGDSYGRDSYERNPYDGNGSYGRSSYGSYQRSSYPSYSRGSYPSYSRGSYPSYSRGSYPSYSRSSAPSYAHGGGSSGGGHPSGGGGGSHGGGGHPPR